MSEFTKACRQIGFWRTVWGTWMYRPTMKLAHRFGWHYAPPNHALRERQGVMHWCQWCGLRGFVMDKRAMDEMAASFSGIELPSNAALARCGSEQSERVASPESKTPNPGEGA